MMIKLILIVLLSIIQCNAGFKAKIGLDLTSDEKERFYGLMKNFSDRPLSNYRLKEKDSRRFDFTIVGDQFSTVTIQNNQKKKKIDGVDYRIIKENKETSNEVFLAQYASNPQKFKEIQPGTIIETTIIEEKYNRRNKLVRNTRKIIGVYGIQSNENGAEHFISEQLPDGPIQHKLNSKQEIVIDGVKYVTYAVQVLSSFKAVNQKLYDDVKNGLLKLSVVQRTELMQTLLAMLDGLNDDVWVTHNSISSLSSQKYSKSELINDIMRNLKDDPKKRYPILVKFFDFLDVYNWKDLPKEDLAVKLKLITFLKTVFFVKRGDLNDYLNLLMSFYDKTLYGKTLPLKDKISLIISEPINNSNDFRNLFTLFKGVTILRYEEDIRQQQVNAVGKLMKYVKRIMNGDHERYGSAKIPDKVIDEHVVAIRNEWRRLQGEMDKEPLPENTIAELLNVVAQKNNSSTSKKKRDFEPERADPARLDELEEKFGDDDAFDEWKAEIEAAQKAAKRKRLPSKKVKREFDPERANPDDMAALEEKFEDDDAFDEWKAEIEAAQKAAKEKQNHIVHEKEIVNAVVENNDTTAEDLESIPTTNLSAALKRQIAEKQEALEEAEEEQTQRDAAVKHRKKETQEAATVNNAVSDPDISTDDLEALEGKTTSPKVKALIEEEMERREEEAPTKPKASHSKSQKTKRPLDDDDFTRDEDDDDSDEDDRDSDTKKAFFESRKEQSGKSRQTTFRNDT